MSRVDMLITAIRLLRNEEIQALAPSSMTIEVGSHSTGCQPRIILKSEDLPSVDVWKGSKWYSSIYEFNDRNKVLGIQPGLEWATPQIDGFFSRLQTMIDKRQAFIDADKLRREAQAATDRAAIIDAYKQRNVQQEKQP